MLDTLLYELNELAANLDALSQTQDLSPENMVVGLAVVMPVIIFSPKLKG